MTDTSQRRRRRLGPRRAAPLLIALLAAAGLGAPDAAGAAPRDEPLELCTPDRCRPSRGSPLTAALGFGLSSLVAVRMSRRAPARRP